MNTASGEVTRKMQDPVYDWMALLCIALDFGFNAKTTFNYDFRQFFYKSPAEYQTNREKSARFIIWNVIPGRQL